MWTSAVQLTVPARSSIESLCIRRDRREQVIVILTDRTKMWETDWRMERQNKVGAGGGSVARITSAALRLKSRQLHGRVRGWFSRDVKKKTRVVRRRSPERENVLYQIVTCKSSLLSEKSAKHTVILMDSSLNTNRFVHWQTGVHGDHTFTLKRWKMADVWTDRTCDDSLHPGFPKWQRDSQKSGVITDDKLWDVDSLWLLLVSPGVPRSSDLCWEFTAKKTRLNSRGRSCLSMQSAEASADHNHVRKCSSKRPQMCCFVQPTVQKPKLFSFLLYKAEKHCKFSPLRSWNKISNSLLCDQTTNCLSPAWFAGESSGSAHLTLRNYRDEIQQKELLTRCFLILISSSANMQLQTLRVQHL